MISYVPHVVWDSRHVADTASRPAEDPVGQCTWELNGPLLYRLQRPTDKCDGEPESRDRHPRSHLNNEKDLLVLSWRGVCGKNKLIRHLGTDYCSNAKPSPRERLTN